jgi:hypothetical protein
VYRKLTHLNCSDASEFRIGGYNVVSGNARRFELPIHLRLRTSLNALEFLACVTTIWLDIILVNIPREACILSQTDSSSAAGWLRKSNFPAGDNEIVQMTMARQLAKLVMQPDCCLFSQWFAGDENLVADSLSREFHLSDESLTNLIISSIPT